MTHLTPRQFIHCHRNNVTSSRLLADACNLLEKLLDENDRLHEHLRQREIEEELAETNEPTRMP